MSKYTKLRREKHTQMNENMARIEAAWVASVPRDRAKEFAEQVAAARARGPVQPPPDMAPGTAPRPPRPGHEPKPPKDQTRTKKRY